LPFGTQHLGILLPVRVECLTFGTPVESGTQADRKSRGQSAVKFGPACACPMRLRIVFEIGATFLKVCANCARFGIVVSRDAEPRVRAGM